MAKDMISRTAARAQDLKWCWVHQRYEPIGNFGKSKGRPDGLQPLCRDAKAEQGRVKRAARDGYKPYTPASIRSAAPAGMKWCAHHGDYCPTLEFGADLRKNDGLQSSCRRGQAALEEKARGVVRYKASKYNPAPAGTKWCCWHKRREPIDGFADQPTTKKDQSGKASMCREATKEYYKANAPRFLAHVRKRQARIIQAVPGWFDREAVAAIYRQAAALTTQTGILHHVDHVVPLRGRNVCGLHVQDNLRAVPAKVNLAKSNKMPDDEAEIRKIAAYMRRVHQPDTTD